MKFDDLCSIAHNLSDSLSSGASELFRYYGDELYNDIKLSPNGVVEIDFLSGTVVRGTVSASMLKLISSSPKVLEGLCAKHDRSSAEFSKLTARYISDVFGRAYVVTVEDRQGRSRTDRYAGGSGRRLDSRRRPDQ